jgi:hypothetical protein
LLFASHMLYIYHLFSSTEAVGLDTKVLEQLVTVAARLRSMAKTGGHAASGLALSTRQMIRIARQHVAMSCESLAQTIRRALLTDLLPKLLREAVDGVLREELSDTVAKSPVSELCVADKRITHSHLDTANRDDIT